MSPSQGDGAHFAVVGLGYVGLPLACELARCGWNVVGIDRDSQRVASVIRGENPLGGVEPGLSEAIAEANASGRLLGCFDYKGLEGAEAVFICVQTPVDEADHLPDLRPLRHALHELGSRLHAGELVVVESTLAPRTMESIVRPQLEQLSGLKAGRDFSLVHCPERVQPGHLLETMHTRPRVIGGVDEASCERARAIYKRLTYGRLELTDLVTAELSKTVENAYRDVQIAFANSVALLCEEYGSDVWRLRELVNQSPFRQMHEPGPGVGGHCIPKDGWLLIANALGPHGTTLLKLARELNDYMPEHVADLVWTTLLERGRNPATAVVVIMGVSYLPGSADTRNSPSFEVGKLLEMGGMTVNYHDPYVEGLGRDLPSVLAGADAAVVMTAHDEYRAQSLAVYKERMRTPILFDCRGIYRAQRQKLGALGITYRLLGAK